MAATDGVNIEVEGLEELEAQLLKLEGKVATKVLRGAMRKAGDIVVRDARSRVPKTGTGALAASLGKIMRKGRGRNFQTMFIAPRIKNKAALALANSARSKAIRGIFYGHIVERGSVKSPPRPFLRPALDGNVNKVVSVFARELKKAIASVSRNGNS